MRDDGGEPDNDAVLNDCGDIGNLLLVVLAESELYPLSIASVKFMFAGAEAGGSRKSDSNVVCADKLGPALVVS